jgi:Zinc knuckle
LDTLENLNTEMPNFPTLVMFLANIQKAFQAADQVQDAVSRLEMLRQGKKTAKELNTEFLQIVGQAEMDRKTPSDHLHLIRYYRKALEPRLSHKILFSDNIPKTINGWMEIAIQFNTNWRMGSLFFNQDMKANPSKQKAVTNKSNGNTCWWRTSKRRDPNVMDVNALTMEERGMLLRQGKCFRCRKMGHMVKDCPPEQGELSKQKVDLARFAYTMIKALTKEQKESFTKMVMEDKDKENF